MEEQSTNIVQMDSDVSVTGVSEGSSEFVRIKQEVDLPEDDTYYPMDFGISVEDEEEMNPVYIKMKSKEPGSTGKDRNNSSSEEDSEDSEGESEEERDEESSGSGEEKSGEEDVDRDQGWVDNYGVRDEEIHQPSTSSLRLGPVLTEMSPVVIKEEPVSDDDEAGGLSYQEDAEQFAESYKMLESLRKSSTGNESRQFDSKLSPSKIGTDRVRPEQTEVIVCGICGDVFKSHGDLDDHLKLTHNSINSSNSVVVGEREGGPLEENVVDDIETPFSQVVRVEVTEEDSQMYLYDLEDEMLQIESHQELSAHNNQNSEPTEYDVTCRLCKKACGNRRLYLLHIRSKHSEELQYQCEVCKAKYLDKEDVESYKYTHNQSGIVEEHTCEACGDKTSLSCHTCGVEFRNWSKLIKHQKVHSKGRHCYCHMCDISFPDTRQTREHWEAHYPIPPKTRVSVQETAHDSHQNQNRLAAKESSSQEPKLCCVCCSKDFDSLKSLLDHPCVYDTKLMRRCPLCRKQYSTKKDFKRHIISHGLRFGKRELDQDTDSMLSFSQVQYSGEPFRCAWCKKEFLDMMEMVEHTHVHYTYGNNRCPVCKQWYCGLYYFRNHLKTHGIIPSCKERQYNISQVAQSLQTQENRCEFCDKKFHSSQNLAAHIVLHVSQRKNRCPVCGMWFGKWMASKFRVHLRTHGINVPLSEKRHWGGKNRKALLVKEGFEEKVAEGTGRSDKNRESWRPVEPHKKKVCSSPCTSSGKLSSQMEKAGQQPDRNGQTILNTLASIPETSCKWCKRKFHDLEALVNHTRIHIINGLNKCPVCRKRFPVKSSFKEHLRSHGIIPPFEKGNWSIHHLQSSIARMDWRAREALREDIGLTEEDSFRPETRGIGTSDQASKQSDKNIHNKKSKPPSVGPSSFNSMSTDSILERAESHTCSVCRQHFSSAELLSQHECPQKYRLGIYCPLCPKWFKSKQNLQYHVTIVHPNEENLLQLDSNDEFLGPHGLAGAQQQKKDTLTCGICFRSFAYQSEYVSHRMLHKCSSSSTLKGSSTPSDVQHVAKVRRFIRIETGNLQDSVKPQKHVLHCQWCQKPFLDKNELRDHAEVHISWGKNCCPVCEKWYEKPGYFKQHLMTHGILTPDTVKPYEASKASFCLQDWQNRCKWCEIEFDTHGSLVAHVRHHIPHVKDRCPFCGLAFNGHQKIYFRSHLTMHGLSSPCTAGGGWIMEDDSKEASLPQVDLKGREQHQAEEQSDDISQEKLPLASAIQALMQDAMSGIPPAFGASDRVQQDSDDKGQSVPHTNIQSYSSQVLKEGQQQGQHVDYECNLCPKTFASGKALNSHKRIHSSSCYICKKVFKHAGKLKRHCREFHQESLSVDASKNEVNEQMEQQKTFQCEICDASFTLQRDYHCHKKLHAPSATQTLRKSPGLIHDDPIAARTLIQSSASVLGTSCSLQQNPVEEVPYDDTRHGLFTSQEQGKQGKQHQNYSHKTSGLASGGRKHLKVKRFSSKYRKNRCLWCKQEFTSGKQLIAHQQTHIVRGRNRCPICKKFYSSGYYFKVHLRVHDVIIPNKRKYRRRTSLKKKKQSIKDTVTPDGFPQISVIVPKWCCAWCTQEFADLGKLVDHTSIHISEETNDCPVCKKQFSDKSYFKEHLRTHGINPPQDRKRLSIDCIGSNMTKSQIDNAGVDNTSAMYHDSTDKRLNPVSDMHNLTASLPFGMQSGAETFDQGWEKDVEMKVFQDTSSTWLPISQPSKVVHIPVELTKELCASGTPYQGNHQKEYTNMVNCKLEDLPYECEGNQATCRFPLESLKETHRMTHSKNQAELFLCDICGESFTDDQVLQRHKQCHKVRPSCACQVCKKTFATGSEFDKHVCSG